MDIKKLKSVISNQINLLLDDNIRGDERKRVIENAEYMAKLSKQYINASDIQIRCKRMGIDERELSSDAIQEANLD